MRSAVVVVTEVGSHVHLPDGAWHAHGGNIWADAQRLYHLMQYYLDNGANSYFLWNMVLDEGGMSTWH